MFFSWQNIKETWNEKVSNGDSLGGQALGILEVVGKSAIAAPTEIAKAIVSEAANDFMKGGGSKTASFTFEKMIEHEKNLKKSLYDASNYEQREKIQQELEELQERKNNHIEKRTEILNEKLPEIKERYDDLKEELENLRRDHNSKAENPEKYAEELESLEKNLSKAKERFDTAEKELKMLKIHS